MRGKDREQFLMHATRLGLNDYMARKFARMAATHERIQTAVCNGDWPADNGERKVKACPKCESLFAPSSFKRGVCPDCRIEDQITAFAAECGIAVELQGDPRGWTVKLSKVNESCAGYPVRKLGRGWTWGPWRTVNGPPTKFKTKREATESFERFYDILLDAHAGRM